jgi:3-oxoacyl-[acyl-carrier protein] reductase
LELNGKTALVTGGLSGIGREISLKLHSLGARVGIFDIRDTGLAELQKQAQGIEFFLCNVADPAQVHAQVQSFTEKLGRVDILVNNAGIIHNGPLVQLTDGKFQRHSHETWDKVIATDLSSVFYMTSCVVEKMLEKRTKGVIVNISSICAAGNAGQSAYSAAKAGVNALTATWAKELGPLGIRVAAVAPGFVETESTANALGEQVITEWKRKVPLRRLGKTEEIVDAVLFCISNKFFNGKIIEADGGLVI